MTKSLTRITTHPGEILKEEFMLDYNINVTELAKRLDVTAGTLSRLITGKSSLSIDLALRLGHVFGNTAMFWVNLQTNYDLSLARANVSLQKEINKLKPFVTTSEQTDA